MPFCEHCTTFASKIGGPYPGDHYLHHPSFASLRASSHTCELCHLILSRFNDMKLTEWILEAAADSYPTAITFVGIDQSGPWKYYQVEKDVWKGLVGLQIHCGEEGRNDEWSVGLGVVTEFDDPAALSGDVDGRRIEDDSGSEGSMKLIRTWVRECAANHPACLPATSLVCDTKEALAREWPTRLPSRVIDVGTPDGSQKPYLYTTDNDIAGSYTALSHRWGKAKLFTTTTSTLKNRQKGFTLSDLPKTFQDAVIITRNLNIRYLWIDSLCIIQDSKEDWQKESARMADIYANAFLTIAATASPDSRKGCLFAREKKETVTMSYSPPSRPSEVGHITFAPDRLYLIDPLRKSPLNTRGWTVQERILSRRILHFAETQLFWDCQHAFLSENNAYVKQNLNATNNPIQQSFRQLDFHGPDLPYWHTAFSWPASILGRWMELVGEYTRRELTYDSDILPALGGIVSRVSQRTGDEFLAGLWKETLHIELLWMARDAPHRAPEKYRAPSWSWANLVGENIYFNYKDGWRNMRSELEVLEIDVKWEGEVCTSKLTSARLKVRGSLEPVCYVDDPSDYVLSDVESYPLVPAPTGETHDGAERKYAYQWAVFDQKPPDETKVLWCLCVCQRFNGEYWHLILEKMEGMTDTYRRIGLARIDLKAGKSFGGGQRVILDLI